MSGEEYLKPTEPLLLLSSHLTSRPALLSNLLDLPSDAWCMMKCQPCTELGLTWVASNTLLPPPSPALRHRYNNQYTQHNNNYNNTLPVNTIRQRRKWCLLNKEVWCWWDFKTPFFLPWDLTWEWESRGPNMSPFPSLINMGGMRG